MSTALPCFTIAIVTATAIAVITVRTSIGCVGGELREDLELEFKAHVAVPESAADEVPGARLAQRDHGVTVTVRVDRVRYETQLEIRFVHFQHIVKRSVREHCHAYHPAKWQLVTFRNHFFNYVPKLPLNKFRIYSYAILSLFSQSVKQLMNFVSKKIGLKKKKKCKNATQRLFSQILERYIDLEKKNEFINQN